MLDKINAGDFVPVIVGSQKLNFQLSINTEISDNELIVLLLNKEKGAVEFLYDKYAPLLYGVICKLIKDDWLAQEILKKAFIQIWTQVSTAPLSGHKLFIWMHNITRNIAIEELSKTLETDKQTTKSYLMQNATSATFGAIMLS